MIYLQLFWVFVQIGLFSFGGGYAAMPLIEELVVKQHGWITQAQFVDLITISESTPGPIALNAATFVGMQMAGFKGAVVATVGNVLPSFVVVLVLALVYVHYRSSPIMEGVFRGLRPAVLTLITSAAITIVLTAFFGAHGEISLANLNIPAVLIFIGTLILLHFKEINPIYIMIMTGLIGLLVF